MQHIIFTMFYIQELPFNRSNPSKNMFRSVYLVGVGFSGFETGYEITRHEVIRCFILSILFPLAQCVYTGHI